MQTSSRQFLSQHGFGIVSFCLDDDMDASFFGIDITSKSPFFTHPHIRLQVVSAAVFPLGIMGELRWDDHCDGSIREKRSILQKSQH